MAFVPLRLGGRIPSSVISIVTARAGLLAMLPCSVQRGVESVPAVVEHGVCFRAAPMLFRPQRTNHSLNPFEPARVRRVPAD